MAQDTCNLLSAAAILVLLFIVLTIWLYQKSSHYLQSSQFVYLPTGPCATLLITFAERSRNLTESCTVLFMSYREDERKKEGAFLNFSLCLAVLLYRQAHNC